MDSLNLFLAKSLTVALNQTSKASLIALIFRNTTIPHQEIWLKLQTTGHLISYDNLPNLEHRLVHRRVAVEEFLGLFVVADTFQRVNHVKEIWQGFEAGGPQLCPVDTEHECIATILCLGEFNWEQVGISLPDCWEDCPCGPDMCLAPNVFLSVVELETFYRRVEHFKPHDIVHVVPFALSVREEDFKRLIKVDQVKRNWVSPTLLIPRM